MTSTETKTCKKNKRQWKKNNNKKHLRPETLKKKKTKVQDKEIKKKGSKNNYPIKQSLRRQIPTWKTQKNTLNVFIGWQTSKIHLTRTNKFLKAFPSASNLLIINRHRIRPFEVLYPNKSLKPFPWSVKIICSADPLIIFYPSFVTILIYLYRRWNWKKSMFNGFKWRTKTENEEEFFNFIVSRLLTNKILCNFHRKRSK